MTKQTVYPRPPLLEQLGALCSLMAHDLANQLCVISGSASFGQLAPDDPKRMATALETIARASEVAGHAVSSFGEYRRTLPTAFVPGPARDIVDALAEYAKSSGWKHMRMSRIHGSILLPPQWAVFAAQGIKTELHSRPVLLKMSMHERSVSGCHGPASGEADRGSNCRQGLQVLFRYESNDTLSIKEVRSRYENLELLAVFELNRMLGGTLESRTICRGNQEIELWLPLEGES
jgi:hypothetical protein